MLTEVARCIIFLFQAEVDFDFKFAAHVKNRYVILQLQLILLSLSPDLWDWPHLTPAFCVTKFLIGVLQSFTCECIRTRGTCEKVVMPPKTCMSGLKTLTLWFADLKRKKERKRQRDRGRQK